MHIIPYSAYTHTYIHKHTYVRYSHAGSLANAIQRAQGEDQTAAQDQEEDSEDEDFDPDTWRKKQKKKAKAKRIQEANRNWGFEPAPAGDNKGSTNSTNAGGTDGGKRKVSVDVVKVKNELDGGNAKNDEKKNESTVRFGAAEVMGTREETEVSKIRNVLRACLHSFSVCLPAGASICTCTLFL